ncbi:MAG: hypothetical protein ABI227_08740 [Rhodanobacter sp.]
MNTLRINAADPPQPMASLHLAESQKHTLAALFRHPVPRNLEWSDVLELLETIGEVDHQDNGKSTLRVGDKKTVVHQPHGKDMAEDEVMALRKFLRQAGWSANGHAEMAGDITTPVKSLLVVVDHHEAKVFQIGPSPQDASRQEIKPYDPHHFLHHLTHKDQDRQRGQRAPEDPDFYRHIATALAQAEQIVVVGHGTGHSNAAHHLVEYLAAYHPETRARVLAELVVDVSSVTPAQLLEMGQQALGA